MFVTVVIPTCHRNDALVECLKRLAPGVQTLPAGRYEVLVTDDGSFSSAQALVHERFPWARWTGGPRRGAAANRNHGVRQATGDWIAFVDDDCLPCRHWLAAYVDAASQGDAGIFEGLTAAGVEYNSLMMEAPVNPGGGGLYSCNMFIKRSIFDGLGGFDEAFVHWNEDVDFGIRLCEAGYQVQHIPNASVEHPPRPMPGGWILGLRWESRVHLAIKHKQVASIWRWLPSHLVKVRAGELLRAGINLEAPAFAARSAVELACVLFHLARWISKYRKDALFPTPGKAMTARSSR